MLPSKNWTRLFACFFFGAATHFALLTAYFGDRKLDRGAVSEPAAQLEISMEKLPNRSLASPVGVRNRASFIEVPSLARLFSDDDGPRLRSSGNRYKVNVVIISNNRLAPLKRLCNSLLASHEHSALDMSLTFNLEASSSHELASFVERFQWTRGHKSVRKRIIQGGLILAVSEAWYPSTSDEYGLFLEDDVELSPFFTDWIVYAMDMYHADEHRDPRLVGI